MLGIFLKDHVWTVCESPVRLAPLAHGLEKEHLGMFGVSSSVLDSQVAGRIEDC